MKNPRTGTKIRNPIALAAIQHRGAGPMKDRRTPRKSSGPGHAFVVYLMEYLDEMLYDPWL